MIILWCIQKSNDDENLENEEDHITYDIYEPKTHSIIIKSVAISAIVCLFIEFQDYDDIIVFLSDTILGFKKYKGGRYKKRKTRRNRKSRKSRKSKKSRKSRKSRKRRKSRKSRN